MKSWTVWYVFDHDEADYVIVQADTAADAEIAFNTQVGYGVVDEVYEATELEMRLSI